MRVFIYSILFHTLIGCCRARHIHNQYMQDRTRFLDQEKLTALGGSLTLSEDEQQVNNILMHWKHKEIDESFKDPANFNLSKHFFAYKNEISKSKVYQIIKLMPKGAALHVHASCALDPDSILKLTYEDHLYACYWNDSLKLHFSDRVPHQRCPSKWNLLSDLRIASDDVAEFDSELRKHFTMYTEDEDIYNADINYTWDRFEKIIGTIKGIINYRPVREKYIYKVLENFYNDNILYVELRSGLSRLYELDGSKHDEIYSAEIYKKVSDKFVEDHPDFIGTKLIYTEGRWSEIETIREALLIARELKKQMPDYFAGFDLVGQEDTGKPLTEYLPALIDAKDEIDFYFHGGETNWSGTMSDENLMDAFLLGSKRIGHAYALLKHPTILTAANKRDIALEINVISNIVLSLVRDVRNHPLATYLALGYPVVLSSDDPGIWEADPLSHDFYVAFVGAASKHADLRLLKQLALNSIRYSALDNSGKAKLYENFEEQWDKFIDDLNCRDGEKYKNTLICLMLYQ